MNGFRPTAGGSSTPISEGAGYVDIGTKRIQWGLFSNTVDAIQTATLNAPFADTDYTVTLTSNTLGKAGFVAVGDYTTTEFTVDRNNAIDGTIVWNWQAIGNKP